MSLDIELLNILACPNCKGELSKSNSSFICTACNSCYKIVDQIPILLIEENSDNK